MTLLGLNVTTALGLGLSATDLTFTQISLRAVVVFVITLTIIRLGDRRFLSQKTAFDAVLGFILASMMASCRQPRPVSLRSNSRTMASGAVPARSRSSALGPSRGSVRCCVRTAPTLASAQAQRPPTAIDEVVTTAPSMPVRAQRPAMEKVMLVPSGLLAS